MAALHPPIALALAVDERGVPGPDPRWAYEPKFDGWRVCLFTKSRYVQSRPGNNLAHRFPELVEPAAALGDLVMDGEVVALRDGRLDFAALTSSPPSRLLAGIVVYFTAFDVLAIGREDLRPQPYRDRRARLEQLFTSARPPLQLVPATGDRELASRSIPRRQAWGSRAWSPSASTHRIDRVVPAIGSR